MHTLAELRAFFTYNDWANDRLIAMLHRVFGEETDLTALGNDRALAIQHTVAHLIGAQTVWRTRWQGHSPAVLPDNCEYRTPSDLRKALEAERAHFWSFFDALQSDSSLQTNITYQTTQGQPYTEPLIQMLHHVLLHSMYHRGQVTARLIDMGHEDALLLTDYIAFIREKA